MAMRSRMIGVALAGTMLFGAMAAMARNGSAPSSHTGAPQIYSASAEDMCVRCHNDYASQVNVGGSIQLVNPPASYTPGTVYTLTLQLASTQTDGSPDPLVWGFQVTALKATDGTGAGTLADVAGQGTRIVSGTGSYSTRRYVEVDTNDKFNTASPVQWQFQWTAPNPGVGAVNFYFSGVAGAGDGGTGGDWTYQGSYAMLDQTTPVVPATWGGLKTRYRAP